MKKKLGIIRKIKKKHIFLALLAVIVLGGLAKAYLTSSLKKHVFYN